MPADWLLDAILHTVLAGVLDLLRATVRRVRR